MNPRKTGPAPREPPLSWDLVGSFLAVMRTGSLSGASRALGVAQPTVRRQVEALESTLGAPLFIRGTAGLSPTEAARAALPYAESMAGVADALVRATSASAVAEGGTVRITCSEVLGALVLPEMLAALSLAHPGLRLELSATNTREDLLRRDADVAVRMVQPTQAALVARRVATVELGLFASPDYLARRGVPRSNDDLARGHALIGRDRDTTFFTALEAAGLRVRRQDFALRTDSDVAQVAALRAGLGIGVCQAPLAARTPPAALVRVLPDVRFELPVWVVTHEDLRASRRVSVVFEHLATSLAAYAGGGRRPRSRAARA